MASRSFSASNAVTYLWFSFLLLCLCLLSANAAPIVHNYEFVVKATPVKRLCMNHNILTVNGQFPGPTLEVRNGDTLIVKVVNQVQYNVTIHWHGVRQMRTAWADGPEYITQCPIKPGGSYTYKFTISGQEGTLWWHAHTSWMRATVYGALIIYPKEGTSYPFPNPHRETPILLGEWWNRNPIDVVNQANETGAAPNVSNAFTINGQPGDLYPCSAQSTTKIPVAAGDTNLFRLINAAMNEDLFVSIAGHTMTVVAVDAAYTKPFSTPRILIAPGQTTDVLVTTNQSPARRYYIAARAYAPARGAAFDNTTTTAILEYNVPAARSTPPVLPSLPAYNDTGATAAFSAGIKSRFPNLPRKVDANFFFTIGLGLFSCPPKQRCGGPNNTRFGASQNNVSFALPNKLSILQAEYSKTPGVFTPDFPEVPPKEFDFTAKKVSRALWQPFRATKTLPIRYGSVVQIVLQDTNIFAADSHPMHLHGYQFYIVGSGFGNFDPERDPARFNLVDPPERNTVSVPVDGWAAIRFRADNPGAWLMHCHLDVHLTWGLATVLIVDNGVGEMESLEPPPKDLPPC